jgi:hypothetical protein
MKYLIKRKNCSTVIQVETDNPQKALKRVLSIYYLRYSRICFAETGQPFIDIKVEILKADKETGEFCVSCINGVRLTENYYNVKIKGTVKKPSSQMINFDKESYQRELDKWLKKKGTDKNFYKTFAKDSIDFCYRWNLD